MAIKTQYFWFTLPANPGKFFYAKAICEDQVLAFLRENYNAQIQGHTIGMTSENNFRTVIKGGAITFDVLTYEYARFCKMGVEDIHSSDEQSKKDEWVEGTVKQLLDLSDSDMEQIEEKVTERSQEREAGKRHRRTKAEMEAVRAAEAANPTTDEPKKRHRRTKTEMEAARRNLKTW